MRLRALVLIATLIGSLLSTVTPSGATHPDSTTLTVTAPSHGKITDADGLIDCGLGQMDCSETYDAEEVICNPSCTYTHPFVELTATEEDGWEFSAWTGVCSSQTAATCQFNMNLSRTVGATFNDASAPTVTMITPPAGWHSGMVALNASASDPQSNITNVEFHVLPPSGCCWTHIGSDNFVPYSFGWQSMFPFGTSGTYGLRARAFNGHGQQTLSSETEIDIDNNAPTVDWENPSQGSPATLAITGAGLPLQIDADDQTSSVTMVRFFLSTTEPGPSENFEYLGDAADNSAYWEHMWTDLSQFSHGQSVWIKAVATDEASNEGESSVFEFVIDTVAPVIQLTQGPAAGSFRRFTSETFAFSSDGELGSTQCRAWRLTDPAGTEKAPVCEAGSPFTVDGLTHGTWKLQVMVTDVPGNQTILERTWTVDTIKPNTKLRSGPKRKTRSRKATFRFGSTETGSKFQCKLDRQRYKSCSSPKTVRRLKKGRHTMRIRAIDRAGNVDGTPVIKRWRVV